MFDRESVKSGIPGVASYLLFLRDGGIVVSKQTNVLVPLDGRLLWGLQEASIYDTAALLC
jgi:hypothetical protein